MTKTETLDEKWAGRRREPGAFTRRRWNQKIFLSMAGVGMTIGYLGSPYLDKLIIMTLGAEWIWVIRVTLPVIAVIVLERCLNKWDKSWLAGHIAERMVGDCINTVLTRKGYAVAHGATSKKGGDIDHLIATPAILWIVETKLHRVKKKYFGETLDTLRQKYKSLEQHWGEKVPVKLVLVVTDNKGMKLKDQYIDDGEEDVWVWNIEDFKKNLIKEVQNIGHKTPSATMERVRKEIWKLAEEQN